MKTMWLFAVMLCLAGAWECHAGSYEEDTLAIRGILDSNGLRHVPAVSFANEGNGWVRNGRLVVLNFRRCPYVPNCPNPAGPIRVLPGNELAKLDALETLDLQGNGLAVLPGEIGALEHLRELYLAYNALTGVPDEICQLPRLRCLALSINMLSHLPECIGSLDSLRELWLGYSSLTVLPAGITQLQNLSILHLSGNRLTSLPSDMHHLRALRQLELRGNDLSDLPDSLSALPSLVALTLHDNRLCSVSPSFVQWCARFGYDSAGINHQRCESRAAEAPAAVRRAALGSVTCRGGEVVVALPGAGWDGYVCDQSGRQVGRLRGDGAGRLRCELPGSAGRVVWVVMRRAGQRVVRQVCVPGGR